MSFKTKKYTINLLFNEVRSLSSSQLTSVSKLASALSPRAGRSSAKFNALKNYVGVSLNALLIGNTKVRGRTARDRLLNALRDRKGNRS